ncbi:type II toxin-antitoxin system antitoxin SocA domain-containing protein [Halobacillus naozhouensis]|uniref:DUF4065 domain-containing protein n=1 Tax=Halobacillus naozhouensis TaxID=554880 RepID=A0ABY8J2I0_9BACI|nr:type II toxin-antitoxin system antitoxin SocA domain-containing protein [Halobacillus naozhouensis]WFT76267.1 DUF4065 domain-containing protein [Halobacillus naozhouensis]
MKRGVLNKFLLLYLIESAGQGGIRGATRLQKMVFASEASTRESGDTNTFNYKFIRWHYGPYSKELKEDIEFLVSNNLIHANTSNRFTLTALGQRALNRVRGSLPNFADIDTVSNIVEEFRASSLRELLEGVYEEYDVTTYNMGEIIEPLKYFQISESPNV